MILFFTAASCTLHDNAACCYRTGSVVGPSVTLVYACPSVGTLSDSHGDAASPYQYCGHLLAFRIVVWPTMGYFAVWSNFCHVAFVINNHCTVAMSDQGKIHLDLCTIVGIQYPFPIFEEFLEKLMRIPYKPAFGCFRFRLRSRYSRRVGNNFCATLYLCQ